MLRRASLCGISAVLFTWCALAAGEARGAITVERIIAKINKDIITLSELQDAVKADLAKLRAKYSGRDFERRRREVELDALDLLIARKLILQRAKTLKVQIDDKDVESAINIVLSRNKMNLERFKRALKVRGISFETYRRRVYENLLVRQVEGIDVGMRVAVTDEEIAKFYEANIDRYRKKEKRKVQQFFFPIDKDSTPEEIEAQKKKAEKAYRLATKKGADFGELVREYSEGPSSERGGDLGFVKQGEVFPEFEKVLFSLPKGKVSRPIKTRAGFHVVRVVEIRPGAVVPFEKVADKIRFRLLREKRAKRRRDWIAELKRAAFLEIKYDPSLGSSKNGKLDSLFRDVRDQVTLRIRQVTLVEPTELFLREKVFWSYGINSSAPRWKSEAVSVDTKRVVDSVTMEILPRAQREFVNPDPAASLFLYEYNMIMPNIYLGRLSFADIIKRFSVQPKTKRLTFLTDNKKARVEFEMKVEKTRSIVADPKDIR